MYECHITIEPIFDEQLEKVKEIAKVFGFKVADLFMQKRQVDTEERSKYDTFLTGHDKDFLELRIKMLSLVLGLKGSKFKVWRYKIEHIIIDSKYQGDKEEIL